MSRAKEGRTLQWLLDAVGARADCSEGSDCFAGQLVRWCNVGSIRHSRLKYGEKHHAHMKGANQNHCNETKSTPESLVFMFCLR